MSAAEEQALTIQIAIIGELPPDQKRTASLTAKLKRIIDITKRSARKFASEAYDFIPGQVNIRFLGSPELGSAELIEALREHFPEYEAIGVACGDTVGGAGFSRLSVIEGKGSQTDTVSSWLTDQADFAVVCCNDNAYGHFVSHCQASDIPAIILSAVQDGFSMWTEKSGYESFNEEKLSSYLNGMFPEERSVQYERDADKTVLGYRLFWGGLYKRFMKRHKASGNEPPKTPPDVHEEQSWPSLNGKQQAACRLLKEKFIRHDQIAIKYSEKYRSSVYLRAIIPLITTIALAIGFYTEAIVGTWIPNIPGMAQNIWSIIAGLGFFTHALLNLYVFQLAENKTIGAWHKGFIENRYIAEALRLVMHFIPFGVPVNIKKTISVYGNKIKKESDVFRRLRCILHSAPADVAEYDSSAASACVNSMSELVNEQISYHKNTANRMFKIYKGLERWGKVIFFLGFGFVLLRGCVQLLIAFKVVNMPPDITVWTRSFANMLALVIPTWAGYFNLKLSLCGFETLYTNNVSAAEGLQSVKQMIDDINNKNEILYEDLSKLCDKAVSTMLGEISEWYGQINMRKVTKL